MQIEEYISDNFKVVDTPQDIMLSPEVERYLDNIIKKEGYKSHDVFKRMISTEGGNYLGLLYEVDIKGKTPDGDKETNLFLKVTIDDIQFKVFFSLTDAYLKESFFYSELARVITELQNEANVPQKERYPIIKGYVESSSEVLILENVAKKGFKTYNRMDVTPIKFAELSIQQLAKLHALSFIIENKRPDYFKRKITPLKLPLHFNEAWKSVANRLASISMKKVRSDLKERAKEFVSTSAERHIQYLTENTKIRRCLVHGDFRMNNILTKETDGEISEVIPIDYQMLHYGCPIHDFLFFIFGCTDSKFRKQHLQNLKDIYYETMSKFLQYFNLDADIIYPRKEFEAIYKERLDYGLLMAIYFFPFFMAPENNIPNCGNDDLNELDMVLDDVVYERINEIIEELIELGYF